LPGDELILNTEFVRIFEVGPRDGLQNESAHISTNQKKSLIDGLLSAGLTTIEVTSFVHPRAVPQMADAEDVMNYSLAIHGGGHNEFVGLLFNEKGYERAVQSGCRSIAVGTAVSDSFSRANAGMGSDEALKISSKLISWAKRDGLTTRAYISTAWVCPFEGTVQPEKTIAYAEAIAESGVDQIAISDTIGHASPLDVGRLMDTLGRRIGMERLAVHLHDTQALGLANTTAALQAGVRTVDSSIGGLGGCPFAPGAAGNLATEDLVFLAYKLGLGTGVDLGRLMDLLPEVEALVGRPVGGRVRAWWESSGKFDELGPQLPGPS